MKSLNTNILVYAANRAAAEHASALAVLEELVGRPDEWILADHVLWEFYRLLRNPTVFARPLTGVEAVSRIVQLRSTPGLACCAYGPADFDNVARMLAARDVPSRRTYDVVLAVTLVRNGVTEFYTRNRRDFEDLGFKRVIDPIGERTS